MKKIELLSALAALSFVIIFISGCDQATTASGTGAIDQQLVGVWFDAVHNDGVQISSDGSIANLMVNNQGALVVNPSPEIFGIKFKSAKDGIFEWEGKRMENGKETTMVVSGTYSISNGGNTLTTTVVKVNGSPHSESNTFIKKTLGEIVTGSGVIDPQLVAAWYDAANRDGVEISSNGTFKMLMVDQQGKLAYNTSGSFVSGKFISASGGSFKTEEVHLESNQQKTYVSYGKYQFSGGGANLTITVDSVNGERVSIVYTMVKKNIGDLVSSTPPSTSLSFTMENQTYSFINPSAYVDGSTLYVSGFSSSVTYIGFYVPRTTGTHNADGTSAGLYFEMGSKTYTSDTGTISVTLINGKNTQGTFSITVQEQGNPSVKKTITGQFNVNVP